MPVKPYRMEAGFRAGIEDAIILPSVMIALAVKSLSQTALSVLIRILDYAFLVAMYSARIPLFTVRVLGDGVIAALQGFVACLPVPQETRQKWSEFLGQKWSRIRQTISYKLFEQAVHRAFERGMEWVFKRCRNLTPREALYAITGAILWLPISLGVATTMHALLLANAASLPAWMQLLHPFATIIAKSKLLVLPVYPAAWPQAKKHPLIQTIVRGYRNFESLFLIQKTEHRYRQTEHAIERTADVMGRVAALIGLSYVSKMLWSGLNGMAMRIGKAFGTVMGNSLEHLSGAWLIGPVVRSYVSHFNSAEQPNQARQLRRQLTNTSASVPASKPANARSSTSRCASPRGAGTAEDNGPTATADMGRCRVAVSSG